MKVTKCLSILVCILHSAGCSIIEDCCSLCNSLRCWKWAWLHTHLSLWRLPLNVSSLCLLLLSLILPCNWQSVSRTEGISQGKKERPSLNKILKYLAEVSRQFLHVCTSVIFLKSVQCPFFLFFCPLLVRNLLSGFPSLLSCTVAITGAPRALAGPH